MAPAASFQRKRGRLADAASAADRPVLTVITPQPGAPASYAGSDGAWGAEGAQLLAPWRRRTWWGRRVDNELGEDLGRHLLVLWALDSFADESAGSGILGELI